MWLFCIDDFKIHAEKAEMKKKDKKAEMQKIRKWKKKHKKIENNISKNAYKEGGNAKKMMQKCVKRAQKSKNAFPISKFIQKKHIFLEVFCVYMLWAFFFHFQPQSSCKKGLCGKLSRWIETPPTHNPPTWFLVWMLTISIIVRKIKCVGCA